MNLSAAKAVPTINGYSGLYRPVWAAKFHPVQINGRTAYFSNKESAELAAWRVLYAVEQRVMKRDGEIIFAARSEAERVFQKRENAA